jgi:hypothetical protein
MAEVGTPVAARGEPAYPAPTFYPIAATISRMKPTTAINA